MRTNLKYFFNYFPKNLITRPSLQIYAPNAVIAQLDLDTEPTIPCLMFHLRQGNISQDTYEGHALKSYITGNPNFLRYLAYIHTKSTDPYYKELRRTFELYMPDARPPHYELPLPNLDNYIPVGVLPAWLEKRRCGNELPMEPIDPKTIIVCNTIAKAAVAFERNHIRLHGRRTYLKDLTPTMTRFKPVDKNSNPTLLNPFTNEGLNKIIDRTMAANRYPYMVEFGYNFYGKPNSNVLVLTEFVEDMLDKLLAPTKRTPFPISGMPHTYGGSASGSNHA